MATWHATGIRLLKTPNIDKLHAQSARLSDFHVDPMYAPTRAALMTGRSSTRTGVWSTLNGCFIPRREETTMGHMFANGGYGTAMFGKWHLGDSWPDGAEHRGFQHVVRHGAGVVGEIPDAWKYARRHKPGSAIDRARNAMLRPHVGGAQKNKRIKMQKKC